MNKYTGFEIAVVGMSARFPGAEDIDAFWENLKQGVESIKFFEDDELLKEGADKNIILDPLYIKANSYLDNKEFFDSDFFNYLPDEAKFMDPQLRLLHECVWKAIEDAGYNLDTYNGKIGLFSGATSNPNWENYTMIMRNNSMLDPFSIRLLNSTSHFNTRISYLLNLKGPSISLNTACSTSLAAIHQACNSLLLGECSMALAGGVTISNFSKQGYMYQDGMIFSKDGHCRPFDSEASGTIGGEGVGIVVLKKLKKAIDDNDHIYAVIKGTGINNDGKQRVGFTAPGINGQKEVIMMAQGMARLKPESISYIEAHGTATSLGDTIEIEALAQVFGLGEPNSCALGSVKSNIGHLDAAAGVAGFIKTILAIKNKQIPPSLYFKKPNPEINFCKTPFYVNTELTDWKQNGNPIRAGVSSFGIGGTNVHVVLEEAPQRTPSSKGKCFYLLPISAKSSTSLNNYTNNLRDYLKENINLNLSDISYTLQTGRARFDYRRSIVCKNIEEAVELTAPERCKKKVIPLDNKCTPEIVFMFSGQGSQYANMCRDLYTQEKIFREKVDECFLIVKTICGLDLKSVLFSDNTEENDKINTPQYTQPLLFIVEYAFSDLLNSWGIKPDFLIGHSIGEYVAACISGVFSLEDALTLVIKRGALMQKASKGCMLSVALSEDKLVPLLKDYSELNIAAVNSSEVCVVAGEEQNIVVFRKELDKLGIMNKIIPNSFAHHSPFMDEILDDFEKEVAKIQINKIKIPFLSNVSGHFAKDIEVSQTKYWGQQIRNKVRFSEGIEQLLLRENVIFLELGPGIDLSVFVRSNLKRKKQHRVINLIRHKNSQGNDLYFLLKGLGQLWKFGVELDWEKYYSDNCY